MDFDEIKQILDMMREHELSEFELERDNFKLRIQKQGSGHWVAAAPHAAAPQTAPAPAAPPAGVSGTPVLTPADEEMELAVIKSPIVGTFYRSAEPGARPFADVGDKVKKGQVLCIIEEINADIDGEVVKVYVENGHAVQYGERLFAIRPA
jgi:acetyl-CoA carboxylase biotin carboxyl carrier protein